MDDTGKLNEATYHSLVSLVAYLSEKYHLDRDHIIRHYDVTGKICPKYYVEHEERWEEFKDDVMNYRAECEKEAEAARSTEETQMDELAAYLESAAMDESEMS